MVQTAKVTRGADGQGHEGLHGMQNTQRSTGLQGMLKVHRDYRGCGLGRGGCTLPSLDANGRVRTVVDNRSEMG